MPTEELFGAYNFLLEIQGIINDNKIIVGGFKSMSGMDSETEIIEFKQGNDTVVRKKPGRTTYANIVKTGAGEWGLASLVQLGKAYENMSTSLTGSYIPEYLTEDQAELYKMGLEDKAYVQIEKAVNVYSEGLNKSFELNLYNDNTAYATRRLGELRPNDFPVLEEDLVKPRFTARARTTSSFEDQP